MLGLLASLLLLGALLAAGNYTYDESVKAGRLLDKKNIDPLSVPVSSAQSVLHVDVNFIMSGLVHVDIAHEKIKFTAAIFLRWRDYNHVWDLKDANTSAVLRPAKSIWYPQLLLTTSVNDLTTIRPDPRFDQIHVSNTGIVRVRLYNSYETSCKSSVVKFPLDTVDCKMTLGVAGDSGFVNLRPYKATLKEMMLFDNTGSEWIIKNLTFSNWVEKVKLYGQNIAFKTLQVRIKAERYPAYYLIILQVPMFLLTCMIAVTTWIPADSGERIGFVINLCLSFILFLLLLDSLLPKSNYSAMSIFVLISYILSIANLLECAIISYFHHRYKCRDPACHPVPVGDSSGGKDSCDMPAAVSARWIRYAQRLDSVTFALDILCLLAMVVAIFVTLLS